MQSTILFILLCFSCVAFGQQASITSTKNSSSSTHRILERLLPGVGFQFDGRGNDVYVDVNPYAGFKLTHAITAGIGWNHRVTFNTKHCWFDQYQRIYGPRTFAEIKIGAGFSTRIEGEVMNTLIPATIQKINYENRDRQWVYGAFVGLKKDYKLIQNLKGTAMVMLRVFNQQYKSPYADVINIRLGFELPLKKKEAATY